MHQWHPQIVRFAQESNVIEGMPMTTDQEINALHTLVFEPVVTIASLVAYVAVVQANAQLRDSLTVPNVRVGNHVAPRSGPNIRAALEYILTIVDAHDQHCEYQTLHPFTDGNGRSGRALWLHRHWHDPALDPGAARRGFLHSWYYHTLQRSDGR